MQSARSHGFRSGSGRLRCASLSSLLPGEFENTPAGCAQRRSSARGRWKTGPPSPQLLKLTLPPHLGCHLPPGKHLCPRGLQNFGEMQLSPTFHSHEALLSASGYRCNSRNSRKIKEKSLHRQHSRRGCSLHSPLGLPPWSLAQVIPLFG